MAKKLTRADAWRLAEELGAKKAKRALADQLIEDTVRKLNEGVRDLDLEIEQLEETKAELLADATKTTDENVPLSQDEVERIVLSAPHSIGAKDVAESLPDMAESTISAALWRLAKAKRIRMISRGRYWRPVEQEDGDDSD